MSNEQSKVSTIVENVACPICGGHEFLTDQIKKGVYLCWGPPEKGSIMKHCSGMLFYCKKCDKYYPEDMFGKHNDVYECKECGTIHWGQTDRKRLMEEMRAQIAAATNDLQRTINDIKRRL